MYALREVADIAHGVCVDGPVSGRGEPSTPITGEAITPSEAVAISGNSAAMSPSPDFGWQRDGIAIRSNVPVIDRPGIISAWDDPKGKAQP